MDSDAGHMYVNLMYNLFLCEICWLELNMKLYKERNTGRILVFFDTVKSENI